MVAIESLNIVNILSTLLGIKLLDMRRYHCAARSTTKGKVPIRLHAFQINDMFLVIFQIKSGQ